MPDKLNDEDKDILLQSISLLNTILRGHGEDTVEVIAPDRVFIVSFMQPNQPGQMALLVLDTEEAAIDALKEVNGMGILAAKIHKVIPDDLKQKPMPSGLVRADLSALPELRQ